MFELPAELWANVFRKLHEEDMVMLCQTCARFHTLAQAQLYETIRLQDNASRYSPQAMKTRMFNESFKQNPSLASLVRTLDFRIKGQLEPCETYPILRALHLFYNLQSITLAAFVIDSNTCSAIQVLPNLNYVRLETCRIDYHPTKKPLAGTVPVKMLDIELFNPRSHNVWKDLFPSGFKSFSIGTYNHTSDRPVASVLTHVTSSGLTKSVTRLVFKGTIPGTAIQFLETLSQLRHIFLPDTQSGINLLLSLPSGAIPFLEKFSGPAELCDVFLRGRPVHAVEMIVPRGVPHDILHVLRLSSVDVRDLHLLFEALFDRPAPTMGVLLQHAPETIQRLAWNSASQPMLQEFPERFPRHCSPIGKIGLLSCVPFLNRFPNLHTLHGSVIDPLEGVQIPQSYEALEMYEKDIEQAGQQELVRACTGASASLRLVIFKGREMDGKWVKWDNGHWEYYAVE